MKKLNLILKELHHAGKPHSIDHLRMQIRSHNIKHDFNNIVVGTLFRDDNLFAFAVFIDQSARGFSVNSSINLKSEIFDRFNDQKIIDFGYTKFSEKVVYGFALNVFDYIEQQVKIALLKFVDVELILSSLVFNVKKIFEIEFVSNTDFILRNKYKLVNSDFDVIQLITCDESFIFSLCCADINLNFKQEILSFRELIDCVFNSKLPLFRSEKQRIGFDFIDEKFKVVNENEFGFELPVRICRELLKENLIQKITIDNYSDEDLNRTFEEMIEIGFLNFQNDVYYLQDSYSVFFTILYNYWQRIYPSLILKSTLIDDISKDFYIGAEVAEKIVNYPGILKRRLCILGRPYLFYHIKSDILDISRDYRSLSDFIRVKIVEFEGDLFSIYKLVEAMVEKPNPEIVTKTVIRLIDNGELSWHFNKIIGNGYIEVINNKSIEICNLIMDEIASSIFKNCITFLEVDLNNEVDKNYIDNFLQFITVDGFVSIKIELGKLYVNINAEGEMFNLDRSQLFLPFLLMPYLKSYQNRRNFHFLSGYYRIQYLKKYNAFQYEQYK